MPIITPIGSSKTDWKIAFDVTEYQNDPIKAPLSAFRKVVSYVDDTEPVQVDSVRLAMALSGLKTQDFKYYFYMLARLERNSKAIFVTHGEMREYFKEKWRETVTIAVGRLIKNGLIIAVADSRTRYIINPVYAWKGNRLDYLDLSSFEDRTGL